MEQTILVANKADETSYKKEDWPENTIFVSAKNKDIGPLILELERVASHYELGNETVVNNARHADALAKSSQALQKVLSGLDTGLTSDMANTRVDYLSALSDASGARGNRTRRRR